MNQNLRTYTYCKPSCKTFTFSGHVDINFLLQFSLFTFNCIQLCNKTVQLRGYKKTVKDIIDTNIKNQKVLNRAGSGQIHS